MSEATTAASPTAASPPWSLWRRQVGAILRLELRRSFLGARALLLYLAALAPVGLMAVFAIATRYLSTGEKTIQMASSFYAGVYQPFVLGMIVFFGCVWIFSNLFRGEILDRSLHYYFLAPVRREVLVTGKFLAGLLGTSVLFAGSTLASYLLIYLPYGGSAVQTFLLGGPGLGHLFAYLGVTLLACLGYGAVFLLVGLLLKNPILPAILLFAWEWLHFLLPPFLKRLSVIHYLKSLCPVAVSEGPFALVSDPPAAWVSIGGLLLFTAAVLALSGLLIRRMEIDYAED